MTYNSHKVNRWCKNHNHKYFVGNQLSKSEPFIRLPQALIANYQIPIASSTSITVVRIIYFTVVLCVYVVVLYFFWLKGLFTNLVSFHFQTQNRDMHVYVHAWSPNNSDRTSKTIHFWACFFYNIFILVSNPIHWYNVFLLTSLFQEG